MTGVPEDSLPTVMSFLGIMIILSCLVKKNSGITKITLTCEMISYSELPQLGSNEFWGLYIHKKNVIESVHVCVRGKLLS